MRCARREVGPNREHEQLQVALLALSVEDGGQPGGVRWRGSVGADAEACERLRRGGRGAARRRHKGAERDVWRLVRESGLRVQRAGKEVARPLEAEIVELGKQWAKKKLGR